MTAPHERANRIRGDEDLRVWREGMDLVVASYDVAKMLPADERFGLREQIRRSAVSVPSNIAEGYGRWFRGDFLRHLLIARGSLSELETQFHITHRVGYLARERVENELEQAWTLNRRLAALIRALRRRT